MKLNIDFDDELIKKYVERSRSPLFTIYWSHEQAAYPENDWLDFGSVTLSWWLVAAESLLEGATEAELLFMDGPFCLHVHRVGHVLHITPSNPSWEWRMSVESFAAELIAASNRVLRKFAELGIPETEGLQVGVQHLKAAMSQTMTVPRNRVLVAEPVSH